MSRVEFSRFGADGKSTFEAELVGEEPLSIRLDGNPYSVVMRTPGDEPAAGARDDEAVREVIDAALPAGRTVLSSAESKRILAAYGIPLPSWKERFDRLEETCEVLHRLFRAALDEGLLPEDPEAAYGFMKYP